MGRIFFRLTLQQADFTGGHDGHTLLPAWRGRAWLLLA